jgi:hypothetical protein
LPAAIGLSPFWPSIDPNNRGGKFEKDRRRNRI